MKQIVLSTLTMYLGSWDTQPRLLEGAGLGCCVPNYLFPQLATGLQKRIPKGDPCGRKPGALPRPVGQPWPLPLNQLAFPHQHTTVKSACSISSNRMRRGFRYKTMSLASFSPGIKGQGTVLKEGP